jgi:predicted outer membrane repeat protein
VPAHDRWLQLQFPGNRYFGEEKSRGFAVGPTGNLTLNNLVIENGFTTDEGSGILAAGPLTLNQVTVEGCTAAEGGGIYSQSPLTLNQDTVVENNTATTGGGIFFLTVGAGLTISNSTITNNTAQGGTGGFGGNGAGGAPAWLMS